MIRNYRAALAALAVVPALVLTTACKKPTVVGKWTGQVAMMGQNLQTTLEFKEGGSLVQNSTTPMGATEATGTWVAEGETLKITVTDVKLGGKSVMAMLPANLKNNLSQSPQFKLDGDTLTLTNNGQAQTLTRVKE